MGMEFSTIKEMRKRNKETMENIKIPTVPHITEEQREINKRIKTIADESHKIGIYGKGRILNEIMKNFPCISRTM